MKPISALLIALFCLPAQADSLASPDGPFTTDHALPQTPATCETLPGWLDKAPAATGRINLTIRGEVRASRWGGAYAYLFMCTDAPVQVVCITNEPHEMIAGQETLLAGGFTGAADGQVVLDPCLALDPMDSPG